MPGKLVFAVMVCLSAFLSYLSPALYLYDFSIYWKAAQYVIDGKNAYDLPHFSSYVVDAPEALTPEPDSPNMVVMGSPISIVPFLLFGFFDLSLAKSLFLFCQILSFFVIVFFCWHQFAAPLYQQYGAGRACLLMLLLPFGFWASAVSWGAPSWMPCLGVILFLWCQERGRNFQSGLTIFLLFPKLHLFVGLFAALFVRGIRLGQLRALAGVVTAVALASAAMLLFDQRIFVRHFVFLQSGIPFLYTNSSLPSVAALLLPELKEYVIFLPQFAAALVLAIVSWHDREATAEQVVAYALPFSLFFAPFAWGHDYTVCIPVAAILLAESLKNGSFGCRRWFCIVFTGLSAVLSAAFAYHFYLPGWGYLIAVLPLLLAVLQYRCCQRDELQLNCSGGESSDEAER